MDKIESFINGVTKSYLAVIEWIVAHPYQMFGYSVAAIASLAYIAARY